MSACLLIIKLSPIVSVLIQLSYSVYGLHVYILFTVLVKIIA